MNDYSENCSMSEKVKRNKPVLARTLSFCCTKKYEGTYTTSWTIEDETQFNVEKLILEAKAQAKTVSIIDNQLYIDYQFVCQVPSSVHIF